MTRTASFCLMLLLTGCSASSKRPEEPSAAGMQAQTTPPASPATEAAPAQSSADNENLQMTSWQNQFAETLADTERLDCPNACRALGSLERSASNICGLVGEKTSTCQDVQKKSADAKTRVRDRCGVCP